jgi:hypothetical protein
LAGWKSHDRSVERVQIAPALEEEAVLLGQFDQRVLQPVIDHAQHPGPERHREHLAGQFDGSP